MWLLAWAIFGEICVVLVAFGFVKHIYYVAKNVWPVKRKLRNPQRVLPAPGVVTLNGIVSRIGENCPVLVTIVENGESARGQIYWRQTSYKVEAHSFALLLPELGVRIVVDPGDNVRLRAAGTATDWEYNEEADELRRVRTAMLEDGDHAIVSGVLSESRQIELVANQYRSQKENVRIEYVMRPGFNGELRVDSETMLLEIMVLLRPLAWVRGIGTALLVPAYVGSLQTLFSTNSNILVGLILAVLFVIHRHYMNIDRRPWFDRPQDPKKPYRSVEDRKPTKLPWGP